MVLSIQNKLHFKHLITFSLIDKKNPHLWGEGGNGPRKHSPLICHWSLVNIGSDFNKQIPIMIRSKSSIFVQSADSHHLTVTKNLYQIYARNDVKIP